MRLRVSDTCSHADEFMAVTRSEFCLGLYEALARYRDHFDLLRRPVPRPHLHVWPNNKWGKWIDAGYGRGTRIILYIDMMQNTAYLSDMWERCQQASLASDYMMEHLSGLFDVIIEAAREGDTD